MCVENQSTENIQNNFYKKKIVGRHTIPGSKSTVMRAEPYGNRTKRQVSVTEVRFCKCVLIAQFNYFQKRQVNGEEFAVSKNGARTIGCVHAIKSKKKLDFIFVLLPYSK